MTEDKATYKVVFWGEVLIGQERQQVADRFSDCFRIADRKVLNRLFSGRLIILKKGISEVEAKQYCAAIRSLGAMCRLERETVILTPKPIRSEHRIEAVNDVAMEYQREELRVLDEAEAETDKRNPFAARDVSVSHPHLKVYDHFAASNRFGSFNKRS